MCGAWKRSSPFLILEFSSVIFFVSLVSLARSRSRFTRLCLLCLAGRACPSFLDDPASCSSRFLPFPSSLSSPSAMVRLCIFHGLCTFFVFVFVIRFSLFLFLFPITACLSPGFVVLDIPPLVARDFPAHTRAEESLAAVYSLFFFLLLILLTFYPLHDMVGGLRGSGFSLMARTCSLPKK